MLVGTPIKLFPVLGSAPESRGDGRVVPRRTIAASKNFVRRWVQTNNILFYRINHASTSTHTSL